MKQKNDAASKRMDHAPARMERAMVVLPLVRGEGERQGRSSRARLEEATGLARAISLDIAAAMVVSVAQLRPATLFGPGKLDELKADIDRLECGLLVIDHAVSPVQQRNLERRLGVKVIDRTGLILEIFGERAQTREGRLQVELAHLTYQRSRLVRSWTHLERQRGGAGFLGGPGESQIELDRRLIDQKIVKLRRALEKVVRTRGLHRAERKKIPYPVIALVGYTNAGKSTLFNAMTRSDVMAKDLLFATLDPTMRAIELPVTGRVILADTVGFISELPHQLVAAFRATLEEVTDADLIVHVRDIAHPDTDAQAADVMGVLSEMGIGKDGPVPIIEALNKIDQLDGEMRETLMHRIARQENSIAISAVTGEGTDILMAHIDALLAPRRRAYRIRLSHEQAGEVLAWLHRRGSVEHAENDETGMDIAASLSAKDFGAFAARFPTVVIQAVERLAAGARKAC